MNIYFHFQKQAKLEERNKLKGFIQSIFKTEKTAFALLNVIFCDDAYLLGINQAFLNHHYFTDVISFTVITGGTEVAIPHKLEAIPRQVFPVILEGDTVSFANVFAGTTAWTSSNIYLTASLPGTYHVILRR